MQYTMRRVMARVISSLRSKQPDPLWIKSSESLPDLQALGVQSCKVVFLLNGKFTVGCYTLLKGGKEATFLGPYQVLIANIQRSVTHWQHYDVFMSRIAPTCDTYLESPTAA